HQQQTQCWHLRHSPRRLTTTENHLHQRRHHLQLPKSRMSLLTLTNQWHSHYRRYLSSPTLVGIATAIYFNQRVQVDFFQWDECYILVADEFGKYKMADFPKDRAAG
ncbi:unnamed protein product, partial [Prorocentrum cordatum]